MTPSIADCLWSHPTIGWWQRRVATWEPNVAADERQQLMQCGIELPPGTDCVIPWLQAPRPCPCPCPTLSPASGRSGRTTTPTPGGSQPHRVQGLVCPQSSWVGVFVHLLGAAPRSSQELDCESQGWLGEGRAQEVQPVLDLTCVLSVEGTPRYPPGCSISPVTIKGDQQLYRYPWFSP